MTEENRVLLEEVITHNLTKSRESTDADEAKVYFNRAMEAIDKEINLDKVDCAYTESQGKLELEREKYENIELKKISLENQKVDIEQQKFDQSIIDREEDNKFRLSESTKTWIFRGVELGLMFGVGKYIDYKCNSRLSKKIMAWEKEETFTSTPGKSLKGMFRFGK